MSERPAFIPLGYVVKPDGRIYVAMPGHPEAKSFEEVFGGRCHQCRRGRIWWKRKRGIIDQFIK